MSTWKVDSCLRLWHARWRTRKSLLRLEDNGFSETIVMICITHSRLRRLQCFNNEFYRNLTFKVPPPQLITSSIHRILIEQTDRCWRSKTPQRVCQDPTGFLFRPAPARPLPLDRLEETLEVARTKSIEIFFSE